MKRIMLRSSQLLEQIESQLEQQISFAVLHFQNMTEEELLFVKNERTWGVAQCLQHLNSYGEYYLPLIQLKEKSGIKNEKDPYFESRRIGKYFINMVVPEKEKKLKASRKHEPQILTSPFEIVTEHLHQQETLLSYVYRLKNTDLMKNKVPISIVRCVKMSLGDVLQFLVAHNSRHLIQAAKLHLETSEYKGLFLAK